ncbi:MAG: DEAD/DEAH box helicase [Nitrospinaceae bacterium]|nr:DEAD/DEAH box helicase [Nitrospinaceae bacterium]MBT3433577.1 DEAD/DEAH box helicase [Nitrospinaceae bacterium]MBT3822342.1 DEAD/DEAH box helicase [Nitrospinaceae bacterium]MBT5367533.1 DEAD/DEAH box helicase [Nitrospinaceae bacterium]MBT6393342.1 DEAD/DEAH box helicase [Nitrospinaceae bacterium]
MTQRSFTDLGVAEPLLRALRTENYAHPTPIQDQTIEKLIAGKDLLGIAQTGTGKTAAFALPILQHLSAGQTGEKNIPNENRNTGGRGDRGGKNRRRSTPRVLPRALILAPTRELAIQIEESFRTYGRHLPLRHTVILGGVSQHSQVRALSNGVDILVATPGRLLDLKEQGHVRLNQISHLVLDEADLMLDMGFLPDVRKIMGALPEKRQTMLFSATMPADVARLAKEILNDPVRVEVSPRTITVEQVDQRVFFTDTPNKRPLLTHLLQDADMSRVIVFMRTKRGASRLAEQLEKVGIRTEAIHGNKTQSARQSALKNFRNGRARVLVATDVAARGIDISGVSHVVNYELPNIPESYVHRVGRTARAGAEGVAFSFCDASERSFLRNIERITKHPITVVEDHPHKSTSVSKGHDSSRRPSPSGRPASKRRDASGPSRPSRRRSASGGNTPKQQTAPGGSTANGSNSKYQGISKERSTSNEAAPNAPKTRRKRRPRSRVSAA